MHGRDHAGFYTEDGEIWLDFEIGAIAIPGHAFVFNVYEDGVFMQSDRWDSKRRAGAGDVPPPQPGAGDSITEGMISLFTSATYAAILERE